MCDCKRGVGDSWSGELGNLPGEYANERSTVRAGHHRGVKPLQVLVLRSNSFFAFGEVDPQLHSVEESTGFNQVGWRGLNVQDSISCRHVLGATGFNDSAAAIGVLVQKLPVN